MGFTSVLGVPGVLQSNVAGVWTPAKPPGLLHVFRKTDTGSSPRTNAENRCMACSAWSAGSGQVPAVSGPAWEMPL